MSKSVQINQEVLDSCKIIHASWNELTKVWTLPVIHALGLQEPARFNELKRRIEGISATSLAERLERSRSKESLRGRSTLKARRGSSTLSLRRAKS